MSIMRKIVLGYVILIFIPVIAFGYRYYTQIYSNLTQQFVESRQKILEQAYANLQTDFARIQSVHRVLQYNPYLTDYLDGVYESDADSVYALTRYILPLYTQSLFANPEIESLVIYKMKDRVLPITNLFRDESMLEARIEETVSSLKAGQGIWLRADPSVSDPDLIYYQYIYNTQITERIGLLEIRVRNSLIRNFYVAAGVEANWRAFLLSEQGEPLTNEAAGLDEKTLSLLQSEERSYFINRKTIINQLKLEPLGVRAIVTGQVDDVFRSVKKKETVLVTMIVLLLLALSIAYYVLASTVTKRILRLARHMRILNDDNLRQLTIKSGKFEKDEIGFLITTYNSMVRRMDELINNVHRAELRNKEAAYQVLQAQIKPHFLYNTLETIRMVAEANNDKEVADISFWFGKLMRYSLSSEREETVLAKEIEMVSFYMKIHKMRLQSRLTYEINVDLDAERLACPRFLLQPLLENGIVHGASAVLRPVHIRLQATESAREVTIDISDNGNGIPPEKLIELRERLSKQDEHRKSEEPAGVGLRNVNERVKAFFGGQSRLEVFSEPGKGTCLRIIITKRAVADVEDINRGRRAFDSERIG
ncbi:sensor histidine kinase [Cohnella lupini]|uniref:histidine kinase n=1 Tax=Cohnella lupini TaxID=1294267 RepID=A0A3D9I3S0_9BACL|nr:histidine kinase [Cohnella lupini]RED56321.1 two-component system sensor histidine kinase YesM [Cohnella lupini]